VEKQDGKAANETEAVSRSGMAGLRPRIEFLGILIQRFVVYLTIAVGIVL